MREPYVRDADLTIWHGDALDVLRELPAGSVNCCVTSPPYWGLRDYGADGQLGLESTPEEYVAALVAVLAEVRRVLADDGTLWLNLGDSYNAYNGNRGETGSTLEGRRQHAVGRPHVPTGSGLTAPGLKSKDMVGIPWRVAFALQADGWYLRSDIIWSKPNPMPESVTDRPTKGHEYVFLLSKRPRYWFDAEAVREPFAPASEDRYRYAFGGGKAEALHEADKTGIGVRTRPIGMRTFPGLSPEAPRGADGRRQTHVEARDGSEQHRNGERWPNAGRNVRSVWEIATQPYAEAHFATFPEELVRRCILAGCPEWVCGTCGNAKGERTIRTPLGTGPSDDPTMTTGRRGMNRARRDNEGARLITDAEQRDYAQQLRSSPHRAEMEAAAGPAFAHYIRMDENGARPLPPALLGDWLLCGWLMLAEAAAGKCGHNNWVPGVVLDPFGGSGTTGLVARKHGRRAVLIELNEAYVKLAAARCSQLSLLAEHHG